MKIENAENPKQYAIDLMQIALYRGNKIQNDNIEYIYKQAEIVWELWRDSNYNDL